LGLVADRAERILKQYPGYLPMYTVGGKWNREGELWTHWCEGFFPGILWLLHKNTGDNRWLEPARTLSRRLEPRQHDRTVHDLGFLFFSTYLREYRLTGEPALRDVLIQAGRTLALRRQQGGYLASFIGPQSLFIDIMMNVGIIQWAANATGDENLSRVAVEHCRATAKYLVRADGGTAHEGIFDLETGQFLRESTHQGWNAASTWTRGLAWSLYGFTAMARLLSSVGTGFQPVQEGRLETCPTDENVGTGFQPVHDGRLETCPTASEFLDVAIRCAECYLRRSPPGLVPLWDFDLPADAPQLWDSSAGAIAASGLWDLSEAVSDPNQQQRYRNAALTILRTLCSDEFLPFQKPDWEGILMHGVYHLHKNLGVDESVAWGEHFFVEALMKARAGKSEAGW